MAKSRVLSNEPEDATATALATAPPIHFLSTDEILVDESQNSRRFKTSDKEVQDLALDINVRGQRQPILVRTLPEGEANGGCPYKLIAGFRRVEAIRHLNENGSNLRVMANVLGPLDDVAAYLESIAENSPKLRKNPSLMDIAYQIKELTAKGLTQANAAKELGVSGAWASDVRKLADLRPELQKSIHQGKIAFTVARQLPGLSDDDQDSLLERIAAGGDKSATDLAKETHRAKARKDPKGRGRKRSKDDEGKSWGTFKECLQAFETLAEDPEPDPETGKAPKETKAEENLRIIFGIITKFMAKKIGSQAMRNQIAKVL